MTPEERCKSAAFAHGLLGFFAGQLVYTGCILAVSPVLRERQVETWAGCLLLLASICTPIAFAMFGNRRAAGRPVTWLDSVFVMVPLYLGALCLAWLDFSLTAVALLAGFD